MPTSHLIIIFIYLSSFFILFLVLSNEEQLDFLLVKHDRTKFTTTFAYENLLHFKGQLTEVYHTLSMVQEYKTRLRMSNSNEGQLPTSEAPKATCFVWSLVVCCLALPVMASCCFAIPKASARLTELAPSDLFPAKYSSCPAAYF